MKRTFHGEAHALAVVRFLNEKGNSPSRKRILELLELLRSLADHSDCYFSGYMTAKDSEFKKLVTLFNRRVARYKMHPKLDTARGPAAALGGADATDWQFTDTPVAKTFKIFAEFHMARSLIRLAELRLLSSLTECKLCGQWLFARFGHQQFCSKQCRVKHNASSEESKAYRRSKAKEYYWLYKTGKVKQR
jgi:hypothetical protein